MSILLDALEAIFEEARIGFLRGLGFIAAVGAVSLALKALGLIG